jgi:hypothetical protein
VSANRKSRRARLPTSVVRAGLDWSPSEDDWRRIESACPFLKPEDRPALQAIMTDAVIRSPLETAAPFVNDAKSWLTQIEKAATNFLLVAQGTSARDQARDAANYAEDKLNDRLATLVGCGSSWTHVVLAMTDIVVAISRAKDDVNAAPKGFAEGDVWDEMICALTDFAASRKYPTAAPKGTDKAKNASTPLFVVLVREIQESFPEDCRRHGQSDIALAQAISVARRGRSARERKSEGKPT